MFAYGTKNKIVFKLSTRGRSFSFKYFSPLGRKQLRSVCQQNKSVTFHVVLFCFVFHEGKQAFTPITAQSVSFSTSIPLAIRHLTLLSLFPTHYKARATVHERKCMDVKPAEKHPGHFSFPISRCCFSSHFLSLASGPCHQLLTRDF